MLRARRQAPKIPDFSPNLETFKVVSLLTKLSEYFLMALRNGNNKKSPACANVPPITTNSGLKILIRPATDLPKVDPTSSIGSIAVISSCKAEVMMSDKEISSQ